jgi:hypothetical protein
MFSLFFSVLFSMRCVSHHKKVGDYFYKEINACSYFLNSLFVLCGVIFKQKIFLGVQCVNKVALNQPETEERDHNDGMSILHHFGKTLFTQGYFFLLNHFMQYIHKYHFNLRDRCKSTSERLLIFCHTSSNVGPASDRFVLPCF